MLNAEAKRWLLPRAYNAAVRAGAVILEIYHTQDYDIDFKRDNTPITIADRRAHQTIKEYLGQTRIPILSEEGREMLYDERKNWELFWMVDPLDGTKEFIKGNNEFTVNIALVENNLVEGAFIYVPYIGRMFFAVRGDGAFVREHIEADREAEYGYDDIFGGCRRLPLSAGANRPIRIAVSRSHNTPETYDHIDAIRRTHSDAVVVEQGSSYKFCMLAEGSVDYYVRTTHTYEWDTAAGELILSEAGGSTCSLPDGEPLRYNKESLHNPWFVCRSCHCEL